MPSTTELYIGLMSGTSMDGIDAVLVDFSNKKPKLLCHLNQSWPADLQQAMWRTRQLSNEQLLSNITKLDEQCADEFANACIRLLEKANCPPSQVIAIGSHGQTLRHQPNIKQPFSLQIGNAKRMFQLTGIEVISNFRTADINAGGQGAPLAPAFHQAVFRQKNQLRFVVNIGGISNISVLPALSSEPVLGYDCGTGNTLMDSWVSLHKKTTYDKNGAWARSGKVNSSLLAKLLQDSYIQQTPPKSTGFEYFNLDWLKQKSISKISAVDVQATLAEFCAVAIALSIKQHSAQLACDVFICGGGIHNTYLMERLQHHLTPHKVQSTDILGVHPDWVEAIAFAWLAYQHNHQLTGNLCAVTGAKKAVILGEKTQAISTGTSIN